MGVFITHISEEAAIALALKKWIESTFLGEHEVFVSSDTDDIPAGSKWLEKVDNALGNAKLLIILCSPASIKRPWVNFEAGCGWEKEVPIIPLCHSGITKSQLPAPLSFFQGLNIDDRNFPQELLKSIAKHLGVRQLPNIDYQAFRQTISEALRSVPAVAEEPANSVSEAVAEFGKLGTNERTILQLIAKLGDKGYTALDLKKPIGMLQVKVESYLAKMQKAGFLRQLYRPGGGYVYRLTEKARAYLIKHGLT